MKKRVTGGGNPLLNNKLYKIELITTSSFFDVVFDVVFDVLKSPPNSLRYKPKWKENIYE